MVFLYVIKHEYCIQENIRSRCQQANFKTAVLIRVSIIYFIVLANSRLDKTVCKEVKKNHGAKITLNTISNDVYFI